MQILYEGLQLYTFQNNHAQSLKAPISIHVTRKVYSNSVRYTQGNRSSKQMQAIASYV